MNHPNGNVGPSGVCEQFCPFFSIRFMLYICGQKTSEAPAEGGLPGNERALRSFRPCPSLGSASKIPVGNLHRGKSDLYC